MQCVVAGCWSKKAFNPKGVSFHKFLSDGPRRAIWLRALNLVEADISKHAIVCSDHFRSEAIFRLPKRAVLRMDAVPELKLSFTTTSAGTISGSQVHVNAAGGSLVTFVEAEHGSLVFPGEKVHNLKNGQLLVGNDALGDTRHYIPIEDPSIDIKHAALVVSHGTVKIVDLFSQFGTYVDGKKIKPLESVELSKSVRLQFGSVTCQFRHNPQSDSGFLALNDSTTKDDSIIPNTPTNRSLVNQNMASSPSALQTVDGCEDECDISFLVKATQPFCEPVVKPNTSTNERYLKSFLAEDDDEFFIPETQDVVTGAPENAENDTNDSCDMFQINTQEFHDGDDNCGNYSDNLVANLSHQISMSIPLIQPNGSEKAANGDGKSQKDIADFESDTDCEEELFQLKLDDTTKSSSLNCTTRSNNLNGSKDGSMLKSPDGHNNVVERAEDLEPTQMLLDDIPNVTDSDKNANGINLNSPIASMPADDEDVQLTQMFPANIDDSNNVAVNKDPPSPLLTSNCEDGKEVENEDFLAPTQKFSFPQKSIPATVTIHDNSAADNEDNLAPTQKFVIPKPRESNDQNNGVDSAESSLPKNIPSVDNTLQNRSLHSDNEDEIPATQAFPFKSNATDRSNTSSTITSNLEETQKFVFPKPAPRKLDLEIQSQDFDATQVFTHKSRTTTIVNKSIYNTTNQERHNMHDTFEPTQVFKIPAKASTSADDSNQLEATQKFVVPSPFAKRARSPSPVLIDSDEEDNNPEFCLAATLLADETPKPISPVKKKIVSEKQKTRINKLFGSDDEDTESDSNSIKISPVTPGKYNVADASFLQPTPNFAFIKLPNIAKMDAADEIFRIKSRQCERKKTVLEESSDEDEDPTELMDRLLTESFIVSANKSPVKINHTDKNNFKQSPAKSNSYEHDKREKDDNVKRSKPTVRKASTSSKTIESDSKCRSNDSRDSSTKQEHETIRSNAANISKASSSSTVTSDSNAIEHEPRSRSNASAESSTTHETRSHSKTTKGSKKVPKKEEKESKELEPNKAESDKESRSNSSKSSKSSEKSKSSSSRRGAHSSSKDKPETKILPDRKNTRQARGKDSADSDKHEKILKEEPDSSKEDRHNMKKPKRRGTSRDTIEAIDRQMPVNDLENVDQSSKKRHISSKDENAVPNKRSKENDPSLVEPVVIDEIISLRKSSRSAKPRIVFTKMDSKPYENIIEKIGGSIVENPADCNVLVSDAVYRTWKLLSALGKGVPIVSVKWLQEISTSKPWKHDPPNYDNYLIKDTDAERRFKFNLKKSLERARKSPVFHRYSFYCTPNTRPVPKELQTIIECAGGKLIKKLHKHMERPDKFFIVSDKSDICMWPDIRKTVGNVPIVSTEGILIAVMQQCVNFKAYLLSE